MCLLENPTVCYRLLPRRYGIDAHEYAAGGESQMTERAQRVVLASRPLGEPTLDNFRLEELPIPQPGPGQMLLRTRWLSLDPYMRGRMSDAPSYAKPVGIGDVMEGGTVSDVVTSNVSGFVRVE